YDYNRVFRANTQPSASLKLLFFFSGLSGTGEGAPIPSDWIIDWRRFFEVSDGFAVGLSRQINPFLVGFLQDLPNVPAPNSLAVRNLLRGRSLGLPPGSRFLTANEFGAGTFGRSCRKPTRKGFIC